jgi:pSer/pThr/pTyr-binding forkhead associated (FHA) protein
MIFCLNKVYIQDTKSSSGTFLNGERLSEHGNESELFEVMDNDTIQFGEDSDVGDSKLYINIVFYQCVTARVRIPGSVNGAADSDDVAIDSQ